MSLFKRFGSHKVRSVYTSQHQEVRLSRGNIAWAVAGATVRAVAEGPCITARCLFALSAAVRGIEDRLLRLQGVDVKDDSFSIHILLHSHSSVSL